MPRVVHFEILADDVERAMKFYTDVFGWNIQKWDGPMDYWIVMTGEDGQPGINGGLMARPEPGSNHIGVACNHIDVSSVDVYSDKIVSNGGTLVIPKMPIQGVGYVAMFKDSEGASFGIIEFDESAS